MMTIHFVIVIYANSLSMAFALFLYYGQIQILYSQSHSVSIILIRSRHFKNIKYIRSNYFENKTFIVSNLMKLQMLTNNLRSCWILARLVEVKPCNILSFWFLICRFVATLVDILLGVFSEVLKYESILIGKQ